MLPARKTDAAHDIAIQTAVERLVGQRPDRPDDPDGRVTAIRRLPAQPAQYAPFPEAVAHPVRQVLAGRGIDQFYTRSEEHTSELQSH